MTPDDPSHVPYVRTIMVVTFSVLIGFGVVSFWVLTSSGDETTRGAIIQTWNNLAIAAGTFWLGSSLGGKMRSK